MFLDFLFDEDNSNGNDYDYKELRKELETEYLCQGIGFSGEFGLFESLSVPDMSDSEVLKEAKRQGINVNKFKK
ncbi:MAG: hypothetical protein K5776_12525 [Lachnospiraceae bacterium]|nr:hypothetical protein [Lachnospiraceae bacterium]